MTISIHPAHVSDSKEFYDIGELAFHADKLHLKGMPREMTPAQAEEYAQWRISRTVERVSNPNNFYFKAVDDETGRIVAACGWHGPEDSAVKGLDGLQKEEEAAKPRYGDVPAFMDQTYFDELAELFAGARRMAMGERNDFWFLGTMYVHPEYQGRGIASRMLKCGTEEVIDKDERGLDCYLECSAAPSAKAIYLKAGFESVADISALDGEYVMSAMVRKSKAKS